MGGAEIASGYLYLDREQDLTKYSVDQVTAGRIDLFRQARYGVS